MSHRCALCNQPLPEAPQLSLVGSPVDPSRKARAADPHTSKTAARLSEVRQGTQRYRLLEALAQVGAGLTSEQASRYTGIAYVTASTRLTELVRGGLAEVLDFTRPTSSGTQAQVLAITQRGRDELQRAGSVAA